MNDYQLNSYSLLIEISFRFYSTSRVAKEPTAEEPGSGTETFYEEILRVMENLDDFEVSNIDPGQPGIAEGIWRTHNIFEPPSSSQPGNRYVFQCTQTYLKFPHLPRN